MYHKETFSEKIRKLADLSQARRERYRILKKKADNNELISEQEYEEFKWLGRMLYHNKI